MILNKGLEIVLKGESMYSYSVKVSYKNIFNVDDVIKNELKLRFIDLTYVLYDYKLMGFKRTYIELRIFCVNGKGSNLFDENLISYKNNIKYVWLEQDILLKRYIKCLGKVLAVILSKSKDNFYISLIQNKKIFISDVIKENINVNTISICNILMKFKKLGYMFECIYVTNEVFKEYKNMIEELEKENEIKLLP